MNLFKLKEEIDNLNKQKTFFEGSLMQIYAEIKKEGFKSFEEMEESISHREEELEKMKTKFEEDMSLAEKFLREIKS